MGYSAFGKIKNVVLPVPTTATSLKQYKEKYGIDLKEFLYLKDGYIRLKIKDNTALYWDISKFLKTIPYDVSSIIPVNTSGSLVKYNEGVDPATLSFYLYWFDVDSQAIVPYATIMLTISADEELSLDNLKIFITEF